MNCKHGVRFEHPQTGECVLCASYGKDYDATERLNQLSAEREHEAEERGRLSRDDEIKALRAQLDEAESLIARINLCPVPIDYQIVLDCATHANRYDAARTKEDK